MNGARNVGSRPRQARSSWFGARWLRIAASALAVVAGAKATSALAEGQVDYRSGVRPSWVEFASRLQQQFQRELAVDNESTARFYDAMNRISQERSGQASDLPPSALVVRAWVTASGKVERLELEGRDGGDALHDLYAVLKGDGVGSVPADMPQPLRMRLSLKPRPEKRDGGATSAQ
jgi:hypothetical protein